MSSTASFCRKSALLLAVFIVLPASASAANSLSISPLKFELTINPGESVTQTVKITNTGDEPATLYTSKEDFVSGDDSGTPKFIKPEEKTTDTYSLANWVKVQGENLTLAKGETREVPVTIQIPKNGEPGWHYGAVFFSPGAKGGSQVSVLQRLGVLLLINVPGNVVTSGKMTGFEVGASSTGATQNSFASLPISFATSFENSGNTHIKPRGKIELIDEKWEKLRNIGKETLINEAGTYIGEQTVDFLPINDIGGNVLPKSNRVFQSSWNGFAYQVLQQDGTKKVEFRTLQEYFANKAAEQKAYLQFWEKMSTRSVKKTITANMTLSYVSKDGQKQDFSASKPFIIQYEETYVTLNWIAIFLILSFFSGIGFYVFVVVPRSREKLKRELMEQIGKTK